VVIPSEHPYPTRPPSLVLFVDTPLTDSLIVDLDMISAQLCSLAEAVSSLTPSVPSAPPSSDKDGHGSWPTPVLASTMTWDKISHCSITTVPPSHWYAHVTWQMPWTPRLTGRLKNFTILWAAESSEATNFVTGQP
jgi:hypothetical protein